MSFGIGLGDGILITQLAWRTVQGAKNACGERDELTRELSSVHSVLQRVHADASDPQSPICQADEGRRKELQEHIAGCENILRTIDIILVKYNALNKTKKSAKKLWQQVKFANGETKNLADIRLKLSAHMSAILMSLNLCVLGSMGRAEAQLNQLPGIRESINWLVANMIAVGNKEGTVLTSYTDDDQTFWKDLRRDLVKDGFPSSAIRKHRKLIKEYVIELGGRGVLDFEGQGEPVEVDQLSSEHDDIETSSISSSSNISEPVGGVPAVTGDEDGYILDRRLTVTIAENVNDTFIVDAHANVKFYRPEFQGGASSPLPVRYHHISNPRAPCTDLIHTQAKVDSVGQIELHYGDEYDYDVVLFLMVPQQSFYQNCRRLDCRLESSDGGKIDTSWEGLDVDCIGVCDLEALLWGYPYRCLGSFYRFCHWIRNGSYEYDGTDESDIDAYLLSEGMASPRFADAVMRQILRKIPSSKDDGNFIDICRYVFRYTQPSSPLQKLYFDVASFWYFPTSSNTFWKGGGIFAQDDYPALARALAYHVRNTCRCSTPRKLEYAERSSAKRGEDYHQDYLCSLLEYPPKYVNQAKQDCPCHIAPWLDSPGRYFSIII